MPSVMRISFCLQDEINLSKDLAVKRAYRIIASKLNTMAIEGRNLIFWVERYGMDNIETYENDQSLEFPNSSESAVTGDSMYRLLQGKHLEIVGNILLAVNDPYFGKILFFHRWTRWYR